LGQVIGRCAATTPAPNVAEQNTTKGASPTGVLCSLAAYWRRTVTVLLNAVCPYTIFFLLYIYLKIIFTAMINKNHTQIYGIVEIIFFEYIIIITLYAHFHHTHH
jgi:hypothetical protein